MEEQLLQQIKSSSYYSLQIDESTDMTTWWFYWHTCDTNTPMMWENKCCVPLNLPQILQEQQFFKPLINTLLNMVWTGNVALVYAQTEQQLRQEFIVVWWQGSKKLLTIAQQLIALFTAKC
jgi:hypothetical protein